MSFIYRAFLYLGTHKADPKDPNSEDVPDKANAELVAMWAEVRTDRLRPNTYLRWRTLRATLLDPGGPPDGPRVDVLGIKERMRQTADALLASATPAHRQFGDDLADTLRLMDGQGDHDGIDVGLLPIRVLVRRIAQPVVPGIAPVIPDAATLAAILAPGGTEYTWAEEDGFGTDEAHFASARLAKAHADAVAAEHQRVTALLEAWVAARTAERAKYEADQFAGELPAVGAFTL